MCIAINHSYFPNIPSHTLFPSILPTLLSHINNPNPNSSSLVSDPESFLDIPVDATNNLVLETGSLTFDVSSFDNLDCNSSNLPIPSIFPNIKHKGCQGSTAFLNLNVGVKKSWTEVWNEETKVKGHRSQKEQNAKRER
ncbi:hypothetical protein ACH5RR_008912 [Cinchona calisaya]|uniref:Uncharacterized protein n=1 Tax=Cinchona calisaya TaxID=153742 RepID=A0ABD3AGM2_9GENT